MTNLCVGLTMVEAHLIGDFDSSSLLSPTVHVNNHVCDLKGEKNFFSYFCTYLPSLTNPNPSFSQAPLVEAKESVNYEIESSSDEPNVHFN